jgi:putative nucleotidyltransferase with HDIG domain
MDMNIGLAGALIMLLDSKDHYTASHSAGVAMYCRDMARIMGLSEDEQRIAHMSGLLHDLGKVGTPDSVLKKKGELTAQEWEQIKQHPTTAAEVLSQLATHQEIADIIRHHQEHFDGSGYPYGKKGEEIPELSRMLAVADTYHALTSNRPYREAKSPFEALIILRRVAGTQLDPKYVEVMAQVLKNEDLSYREGSKADFLSEFRKGRPALKLDALRASAEEH